jgi:hypothetical protein
MYPRWYFGLFPKPRCHELLKKNGPSHRAMAKVSIILFCWDLVKESRKTPWPMPMVPRYLVNQRHNQAWFSCVLPVNAPSREVYAVMRSAMS